MVDEAQVGNSERQTCKMMGCLQHILLIPGAWRMHKIKFSGMHHWDPGWNAIVSSVHLEKLFFQECGRTVNWESVGGPLFKLGQGYGQLLWVVCIGEEEKESPHWLHYSLGETEACSVPTALRHMPRIMTLNEIKSCYT